MIKSVGSNSSSKCRLYCAKQPNPTMSSCSALHCVDLCHPQGWMIYPEGFIMYKNSVPAENGQYKRLDDKSVDGIIGFYYISRVRNIILTESPSSAPSSIVTGSRFGRLRWNSFFFVLLIIDFTELCVFLQVPYSLNELWFNIPTGSTLIFTALQGLLLNPMT